MARSVIVITVEGNQYKIEKNGISDFALIGVLECLVSDLKSNRLTFGAGLGSEKGSGEARTESPATSLGPKAPAGEQAASEMAVEMNNGKSEDAQYAEPAQVRDIRNRIMNARRAIRELDGKVEEIDLSVMSPEELQTEFEELTNQYKRLKKSRNAAKGPRK